jgi:uncharacterized protein (DUF1778 family)
MTNPIVPPAAESEPRDETMPFRCSATEKQRIQAAAESSGHKASVFMRLAVMAAVEAAERAAAENKPARKGGRG